MDALLSSCQDKQVVLAGCGGGCDVFGVIPMFLKLREKAKVILVNLSFTNTSVLQESKCYEVTVGYCYKVNPNISEQYEFPEACLARVFKHPVYTIGIHEKEHGLNVGEITKAYEDIFTLEGSPEVFFLVDGGCDVLLRGDETELGTPVEDIMHLKAVRALEVPTSYVAAIGVDCDFGHRVVPKDLEERLDTLQEHLITSWLWEAKEEPISEYINFVMSSHPEGTIVHSLIVAALQGHQGFYLPEHLKVRITESRVELNERIRTMFVYPLEVIAKQNLYLDKIGTDDSTERVDEVIEEFRESL